MPGAMLHPAISAPEPQLIKTHAGNEDGRGNHHASDQRLSGSADPLPAPVPPRPFETQLRPSAERAEARFDAGNGQAIRFAGPAYPANGERGRLHLSLGNGGNGNGSHSEPHHAAPAPAAPQPGFFGVERPAPQPAAGVPQGFGQAARQPFAAPVERHGGYAGNGGVPAHAAAPQRPADNAAFIDRSLRERVDTDIAAFLAAFDVALDHDTLETRAGLREATDRLLRAGARTRIELERLEARMPLPPREGPRAGGPAWPQR